MAKDNGVNGHRPDFLPQLLHPAFKATLRPQPARLGYDLDRVLAAIMPLRAEIPDDAFTAPILGTEREGSGILIDGDGLILTIGYLIIEAETTIVVDHSGRPVPARVVAYDYDSGFGLVRAQAPLGRPIVELSADGRGLGLASDVVIAAGGGFQHALAAKLVGRRPFVGYWEYMLDDAYFTAPPHPNWGGAGLIAPDGRLAGVGSLYVQDAVGGTETAPGNMFVPIQLLFDVFDDLIRHGRSGGPARPWLGLFTAEHEGSLIVIGAAPTSPAAESGLQTEDLILRIAGEPIASMADFYRLLWSLGEAGIDVPLTVKRGANVFELAVASADRYRFLKMD